MPGYLPADPLNTDATNEAIPRFGFGFGFVYVLGFGFVTCLLRCCRRRVTSVQQIRWVVKPTFRAPYDLAAAVSD